jgi:hypothetical protein
VNDYFEFMATRAKEATWPARERWPRPFPEWLIWLAGFQLWLAYLALYLATH